MFDEGGREPAGLRDTSKILLLLGGFLLVLSGLVNPMVFAASNLSYGQPQLIRDVSLVVAGTLALGLGFVSGYRDLGRLLKEKRELNRAATGRWPLEWGILGAYSRLNLTQDQVDRAVTDYLDCIVQACHKNNPELTSQLGNGYFWTKIYRFDRRKGLLEAAYVSANAPKTAKGYSLALGAGGAGRHAKWALNGLRRDRLPHAARLYTLEQMKKDIPAEQVGILEKTGIRTVLCAAIFPQCVVISKDRMGLKRFIPPGEKYPRMLGVLCFCSKLDREESTLSDVAKHQACASAAQVAGILMIERV